MFSYYENTYSEKFQTVLYLLLHEIRHYVKTSKQCHKIGSKWGVDRVQLQRTRKDTFIFRLFLICHARKR